MVTDLQINEPEPSTMPALNLISIPPLTYCSGWCPNGMGGSQSLPDLFLMMMVIMLWDYMFKLIKKNLRREKLTEEELVANLRMSGVPEIAEVWQAVLEADGQISIIKKQ